jgi:hypothetical protein
MNPLELKITEINDFYVKLVPHVQALQLNCGPGTLLDVCATEFPGTLGISHFFVVSFYFYAKLLSLA